MLKQVALVDELSQEYLYYDGILLVNAALPVVRILEIISAHLGGDATGN